MKHKIKYAAWLVAAHLLALTGAAQGTQTCDSTISPSAPATRFVNTLRNGTVVDTATGLTWKKCSEGQTYESLANSCSGQADTFSWQQALQRAQAVDGGGTGNTAGYAGQNDWRVPNIKELRSLVEQSCREPAIDPSKTLFPLTRSGLYWSSSPYAGAVGQAWGVDFTDGSAAPVTMGTPGYLRLVRGGL